MREGGQETPPYPAQGGVPLGLSPPQRISAPLGLQKQDSTGLGCCLLGVSGSNPRGTSPAPH